MIVFGFSTCFLYFLEPLWAATARASEKEKQQKADEREQNTMLGSVWNTSTNSHYFLPSQQSDCPIAAVHVAVSFAPACEPCERMRRKHNLMVLCGLRIDRNAVDGFSFLMTFGGASWRNYRLVYSRFWINVFFCGTESLNKHAAERTFLFWNSIEWEMSKILSWNIRKRKVRRNIFGEFWRRLKVIRMLENWWEFFQIVKYYEIGD